MIWEELKKYIDETPYQDIPDIFQFGGVTIYKGAQGRFWKGQVIVYTKQLTKEERKEEKKLHP